MENTQHRDLNKNSQGLVKIYQVKKRGCSHGTK